MSKRYEDEIRDLLKGMDRFPGEGGRPPRRAPAAWRTRLASDPQRLMGGALLLTLCAWVLGGPWSRSFPMLVTISGWTQVTGIVLFVVAFALLLRRGGLAGPDGAPPGSRASTTRWRGQVIEMPRRRTRFPGFGALARALWQRATGRRTSPPWR